MLFFQACLVGVANEHFREAVEKGTSIHCVQPEPFGQGGLGNDSADSDTAEVGRRRGQVH